MKLLILMTVFLFQTLALAVRLGEDPNNRLNRTSADSDRSNVQAAVPHNGFYCPPCVAMELARKRKLGDFQLPAESRGAFTPGRRPLIDPASPAPATDSNDAGTTN